MNPALGQEREFGRVILSLPNGISVRGHLDDDAIPLANAMNNRKVWDNMRDRIPHPYTEADSVAWIRHCQSSYIKSGPWDPITNTSSGPEVATNYAVTVNGKAIGGIGLEFGNPNEVYKRTAELGYWIGEEYWKRGIISAIVPHFVDWAWRTFGILLRLNSSHYERNVGSGKVLQKAGFKQEGRREASVWKNGQLESEVLYGFLRPDMI